MPQSLTLSFEKVQDLAYGENPHQRAAYYRELGARRDLLSQVEQLHGRALSFVNLYDLAGGLLLLARVHAADVRDRQARERVRRRDGGDDRGGVRAGAGVRPAVRLRDGLRVNRPVTAELATGSRSSSWTSCTRPTSRRARSKRWGTKPRTRILVDRERREFDAGELDYKRVPAACSSRIATATSRSARR